ncbi:MAG: hypothetical protein HXY34_07365 [Candidatus Thorarchaeota archaeon]|nr:hypothetical protein [Candidatus Thorarchaeota archaeon]
MSRVDKYNPMKSSALSRKRDRLKEESATGKATIREIVFEEVRAEAIEHGLATDVLYQMSAGKEASIFLAEWNGHPIVLKVYRLYRSSHKMSKKSGFQTAASTKRTYCTLDMIESLAVAEYDLLARCFRAGIRVPTPISRVGNYLTMRFLGDGRSPAPQLRNTTLDDPEVVLGQILDDYLRIYRDVHYVHGDLSAYNVLWWQHKPWIIDLPQGEAVDTHCDMRRIEIILKRDIHNLLDYFAEYDLRRDENEIVQAFLAEYIPANQQHYDESTVRGGL